MGTGIGLKEYIAVLLKRKNSIVGITIAAMLLSAVLNFYVMSPVYEASSTIMVTMHQGESEVINYDDVVLYQKLAVTYGKIVKSKTVMKKTMNNLGIESSLGAFSDAVSVEIFDNTELLEIKVLNNDPEKAMQIANSLTGVFMDEVSRIMDVKNIKIIDRAEIPEGPVKPRKELNIVIAGILGLTFGIFVAFLREYLDDTIRRSDDVEKYLGVNVIGVVPRFKPVRSGKGGE